MTCVFDLRGWLRRRISRGRIARRGNIGGGLTSTGVGWTRSVVGRRNFARSRCVKFLVIAALRVCKHRIALVVNGLQECCLLRVEGIFRDKLFHIHAEPLKFVGPDRKHCR
jgi:hypothetical protein